MTETKIQDNCIRSNKEAVYSVEYFTETFQIQTIPVEEKLKAGFKDVAKLNDAIEKKISENIEGGKGNDSEIEFLIKRRDYLLDLLTTFKGYYISSQDLAQSYYVTLSSVCDSYEKKIKWMDSNYKQQIDSLEAQITRITWQQANTAYRNAVLLHETTGKLNRGKK